MRGWGHDESKAVPCGVAGPGSADGVGASIGVSVGGGTGMMCFGLKGGTGTASRVIPEQVGGCTVAVLVQCNSGNRSRFSPLGVPVGRELPATLQPCRTAGVEPTRQLRGVAECPGSEGHPDVRLPLRAVDRSLSLSPQTHRCCHTSSSGLRRARRWPWVESEGSARRIRRGVYHPTD
jgi:hypothetical protein